MNSAYCVENQQYENHRTSTKYIQDDIATGAYIGPQGCLI